jgi:subtilisin family serine protease
MRFRLAGAIILLSATLTVTNAQAQKPVAPSASAKASRILIKLRPGLAANVEPALPLTTMSLAPGDPADALVQAFMREHHVAKMAPVFPSVVRIKKQQHLTDRQIANNLRTKFSARSKRLRGTFNPPEISRNYVLDLSSATAEERERTLTELRADPNVEYAEEDQVRSVVSTPNDPYFSSTGTWGQAYADLWGVKKVNAPAAWDTTTGAGITVAVVDTGIDYNHPDIAANVWHNTAEIPGNGLDDDGDGYVDDVKGFNFAYGIADPMDDFGHGTHVAGTIAAVGNNHLGVVGVAYGAKVMAVKALDSNGSGFDSNLSTAIHYATDRGADVINASWGGFGKSQTVSDAIDYAGNLGVIFVAAAGNSSDDAGRYWPAGDPQAITVAASDSNDALAYFSNFGSKIDVAAPGVDVLSLQAAGTALGPQVSPGYVRLSGTSMAAPHVAGVVALILVQHPAYTTEDVRQVLRTTATDTGAPGYDNLFGYGRLNALGAVTLSNVLKAKITFPVSGSTVQGSIAVSGIATGNNFANYVLEYGAGATPTTWAAFATSTVPGNGVLGNFDPTALTSGTYSVRLTATDTFGHQFVDRITLQVNLVTISYPVPPNVPTSASTYKPGMSLRVNGSANVATLQNFQLQWAAGVNASTGYSTNGIVLANGGTMPVNDGNLGTWSIPSDLPAGYYTIQLITNAAAYTATSTTLVYLEPSLTTVNWPVLLPHGIYPNAGVIPTNNADGSTRLTATNSAFYWTNGLNPADFLSYTADGTLEFSTQLALGSPNQPAVADLDEEPGDESVVTDARDIDIFHEDHSKTTYTVPSPYDLSNTPVQIDDLQGNGEWDILSYAIDPTVRPFPGRLFLLDKNGSEFNSHPIDTLFYGDLTNERARFLPGFFLGNGLKQIVIQDAPNISSFSLKMFDTDGSPIPWNAPTFLGTSAGMAAADFDHNGTLETIIPSYNSPQMTLHVLQPDGSERPGWPLNFTCGIGCWAYVAIGDLFKDGNQEILFAAGPSLYLLDSYGHAFPGFPITLTNGSYPAFGTVLLGDIDGDGYQEIVTTSRAGTPAPPGFAYGSQYEDYLLAYNRFGAQVRRWLLTGRDGYDSYVNAVPSIGDFNQDGITDIAVSYEVTGIPHPYILPGVVSMVSTGGLYNAAANDWPLMFKNARNVPVVAFPQPPDQEPPIVSITAPADGAKLASSTLITATASDNRGVAKVEFYIDGQLTSSSRHAPYSYQWSADQLGQHSIYARAYDGAGNQSISTTVNVEVVDHFRLSAGLRSHDAVAPGQTATLDLLVAPGSQPEGNVALSCVAGAGATCSVQPGVLDPSVQTNAVVSVNVPDNVPVGTVAVTVTGTEAADGVSKSFEGLTVSVQDYSFTLVPSSLHLLLGMAQTFTLSSAGLNGFGSPIAVSCPTPMIYGWSCTLDSEQIVPGGSATGTILAAPGPNGSVYISTVHFNGVADNGHGLVTHTGDLPVVAGDLTLQFTPATTQIVVAGSSRSYTVTQGEYNLLDPISLSCENPPAGVNCTFNPAVVYPNGTSTLAVSALTGTASFGLQTINVKATVAGSTKMGSLQIRVVGFELTGASTEFQVNGGGNVSATSHMMVRSEGGFASPVQLSCGVGLPAGVTCSFSPNNFVPSAAGTSVSATVAATSATPVGVYSLQINAAGQGATRSLAVPLTVRDFSINVPSGAQTVPQPPPGQSSKVTIPVTLTSLTGFTNSVALSCSGQPTGVTCAFSPASMVPTVGGVHSTLTITGASTAVPGLYNITVKGTAGTLVRPQTLAITLWGPNFTQAVTPTMRNVTAGSSAAYTVTYTSLAGMNQDITVGCGPLPAGVTCTANPPVVTPGVTPLNQSIVTLQTTFAATPAANTSIAISGTNTGLGITRSNNVTLSVKDFSVTANAPTIATNVGSNISDSIVVKGLNGFTGNIALGCAIVGGPAGINCKLSNVNPVASAAGTSVAATISSIADTTPPGTYTVQVTGTSVSGSKTAQFTANIKDFTLATGTAAITIPHPPAGQAVGVAIPVTLTALSGFNSSTSLSCTGQPSGITCVFSPGSGIPTIGGLHSTLTVTSISTVLPKTYHLHVRAAAGTLIRLQALDVTDFGPNFTQAVAPATQNVLAGSSVVYTVTYTPLGGMTEDIAVSCGALPTGVTCNPNPAIVTPTVTPLNQSLITLHTASGATPAANDLITIIGNSAAIGVTRSTNVTLSVKDFSVAPNMATISTNVGSNINDTIVVKALNGFSGSVALGCVIVGAPAGMGCRLSNPNPAASVGGTSVFATITSTAASTPAGSYTVQITGSNSAQSKSTQFTVNIIAVAPASPASQSVSQPGN